MENVSIKVKIFFLNDAIKNLNFYAGHTFMQNLPH